MNPFAQFAFGAKESSSLSSAIPCTNGDAACQSPIKLKQVATDDNTSLTKVASPSARKRTSDDVQNSKATKKIRNSSKCGSSNKSSPEIMAAYWIELKSLTSNYPFAVLLTGVLGAQTRDIVTVGVMKELASSLDGDICPLNICGRNFEELEFTIKRLNYCHKKTRSMMDLAAIFRTEPVPSTMHGLKTIPGVGPVISEIILRVAFGAKFGENNTSMIKDEVENINDKGYDQDSRVHEVSISPSVSHVHSNTTVSSSSEVSASAMITLHTPVKVEENDMIGSACVIDLSST